VGFDLYCRILAAAVDEAKAEQAGLPATTVTPVPQAAIDLRLPAHLPEDYVQDLDARLELYRRLATATELSTVDEMNEELRERFGPLPTPAKNLLYIAGIKLLATQAGAASVAVEEDRIVIRLQGGRQVDRQPQEHLPGVTPGNNQVHRTSLGRPARWQPLLEEVLLRMGG
jgi:transcription-repair coupling factor (superfamily II helicase)